MKRAASGAQYLRGIFLAGALALPACGVREPAWTEYEETTSQSAATHSHAMRDARPARASATLKWKSPDGWKAQPASSMRLGSYAVESGARTGLCTIVRLGGAAGGVEANVKRWIGQIEQQVPPPADFAAFMAGQEKFTSAGGLDGVLIDLTTIGTQGPEQGSMLGAIFMLSDMTVFVKLTGPAALLGEQKAAFAGLCKSLAREDG